jgi:hypothetical protein
MDCLHLQNVDADKLFNLFSNYGNITRIKILHNKPDHALIQMGDGFQAELAFNYLKVCKSIISTHTVMKILCVMVSLPMVHHQEATSSSVLSVAFSDQNHCACTNVLKFYCILNVGCHFVWEANGCQLLQACTN